MIRRCAKGGVYVLDEPTPGAARSTLKGEHLAVYVAGSAFVATICRPTPSATRSMSNTVWAQIMWTSRWMRCSSLSR